MKKIVKNILLTFIICLSVLNIIGLVFNKMNYDNLLYKEVTPILNGQISNETKESDKELYNKYKDLYGIETPSTILAYMQGYFLGQANIMEMQITFLIISLLLGITLGIIISLSEQSKYKQVLMFFIIGIIIALIYTTYIHATRNLPNVSFKEGFIDTLIGKSIKPYWIYYILVYFIIFVTKYLMGKKYSKDLNNQIKDS